MQPGSGGVPTRQRGFPKCPVVLGWVAAGQNGFLQFAEEPFIPMKTLQIKNQLLWQADASGVVSESDAQNGVNLFTFPEAATERLKINCLIFFD